MAGKSGYGRGRPPAEFSERARALIDRHQLWDVAAEIAQHGQKDADRLAAVRLLLEYGYGKPTQPLSTPPEGLTFTLDFGKDAGE